MKPMAKGESASSMGFWARFAIALEGMEMSSVDLLESRIKRLEHQVARLTEANERRSGNTSPAADVRRSA
jgi:uncharacterized small protein (DUF1192 family)